jgi:predicted DCC family thiol-disulfide oxidoreductase YuxK
MAIDKVEAVVIYDGECPFCADFIAVSNLREAGYKLELVNARDKLNRSVLRARDAGLNLDKGMVVLVGGLTLYGVDAANFIILNGNPKAFRAKFYRLLLSNVMIARISYPVLVFLRRTYFFLTGRRLINE